MLIKYFLCFFRCPPTCPDVVEVPGKIKGQFLYPDEREVDVEPSHPLPHQGSVRGGHGGGGVGGRLSGSTSQIVLSAKSLGNMLKPKRPFKAKGESCNLHAPKCPPN